MRALFYQYYERVSASYWFLPSVMAIMAAIVAFVLIQIDRYVPPTAFGSNPFLYAAQPDGARAVLSAIGGSMIGVAGTVFSVTMATVVFASGSYGPRLLTNFMNNRGNQITLGTFVATFVYSTIVLRSVRDGSSSNGFAEMFVPNIALFGAIILGICSIGVLIFFIHHVPSNINISNVIADIGWRLISSIDKRFPLTVGEPASANDDRDLVVWQVPACFRKDHHDRNAEPEYGEVETKASGYIQVIDYETVMGAARDNELVVRMNCQPGTFAHPGRVLFDAWPKERLTDAARAQLVSGIALGTTRSVTQDLLFLFDELVEIAARALSPGVNDPFTAVTCMDWLGSAFSQIAGRHLPDPLRVDEDGKLRIVGQPIEFAGYLEHAFGQLRQYVAADMVAACHLVNVLGHIAHACQSTMELDALRGQKNELLQLARENLKGPSLARVEEAAKALDMRLNHPRRRMATTMEDAEERSTMEATRI